MRHFLSPLLVALIAGLGYADEPRGKTALESGGFEVTRGPFGLFTISADGNHIAVGTERPLLHTVVGGKTSVAVWSLKHGKQIVALNGHIAPVCCLEFSPDGRILATGSYDETVRLWEIHSGRLLGVLQDVSAPVSCVAFSADGGILAAGAWYRGTSGIKESKEAIHLWDVKSRKHIAKVGGDAGPVSHLRFHPDGKRLFSGSADKSLQFGGGKVSVWDWKAGTRTTSFKVPNDFLDAMALNPTGDTLATGGCTKAVKGEIRLWDVKTGTLKISKVLHQGRIESVSWADDNLLVIGQLCSDVHSNSYYGLSLELWREAIVFDAKLDRFAEIPARIGSIPAFIPCTKKVVAVDPDYKRLVIWSIKPDLN